MIMYFNGAPSQTNSQLIKLPKTNTHGEPEAFGALKDQGPKGQLPLSTHSIVFHITKYLIFHL